jgi:hypothetical protein
LHASSPGRALGRASASLLREAKKKHRSESAQKLCIFLLSFAERRASASLLLRFFASLRERRRSEEEGELPFASSSQSEEAKKERKRKLCEEAKERAKEVPFHALLLMVRTKGEESEGGAALLLYFEFEQWLCGAKEVSLYFCTSNGAN